mgnify:CR=1 FL=1
MIRTSLQVILALAGVLFAIMAAVLTPNIVYWFRQLVPKERAKGGRRPKKQPTILWSIFWISLVILLSTTTGVLSGVYWW